MARGLSCRFWPRIELMSVCGTHRVMSTISLVQTRFKKALFLNFLGEGTWTTRKKWEPIGQPHFFLSPVAVPSSSQLSVARDILNYFFMGYDIPLRQSPKPPLGHNILDAILFFDEPPQASPSLASQNPQKGFCVIIEIYVLPDVTSASTKTKATTLAHPRKQPRPGRPTTPHRLSSPKNSGLSWMGSFFSSGKSPPPCPI